MQLNLELTRGHLETRAVQDRDKAEIRELLLDIIQSNEDMKTLFNMHASQPFAVEDVMESLQTVGPTKLSHSNPPHDILQELRNSYHLEPNTEQNFREGLWRLHQQTSMLPPLEDRQYQFQAVTIPP